MKPKKPKQQDQADLFRSQLDQILDRRHPLFVLANQIDWPVFDTRFGRLYADKGRPALSTRLMVGLHYLKGTEGDKMNAILAACGFNLRKLLRAILWLLFKGLERLKALLKPFILPNGTLREWSASFGINLKLQSSVV